jgi:DnaJ-class molecular chaperone
MNTAPQTEARDTDEAPCPVCDGTGETSRAVRVGRKRRVAGHQSGLCLNCFGTGTAPTS